MNAALRYGGTAIALHWIVAILILANLALGFYTVDLPLSPQKLRFFSFHKWIGVTVFLVAALRLLWRLSHPAPGLPGTMKAWEQKAARTGHFLLYVLFFATPASGWLFSSAGGFQTVFLGVLPIPDLVGKDKALAEVLQAAHHGMAWTLAALVAAHVLAALKHHFVDHDDVLSRMLPMIRPRMP
jgi:cytochrome b561